MRTIIFLFLLHILIYKSIPVHCNLQVLSGDPENPPCTLASPEIRETKFRIPGYLLEDGEKAWIGYARERVVFQYIGCISYTKATSRGAITYEEKVPTVSELGICFNVCSGMNSPVFGMQGHGDKRCKCFGGKVKELEAKSGECNTKCSNNQFWCGGERHISFYEKVESVDAKELFNGSDRCLLTSSGEYFWQDCEEERWAVCQKGSYANETEYERSAQIWGQLCFEEHMYPMIYREAITRLTFSYWTAVIQTKIVRRASNWPSGRNLEFGYIEGNGGAYHIRFTVDRNATTQIICVQDDPDSTNYTTRSTSNITTESDEISTTEIDSQISENSRSSKLDQAYLENGISHEVAIYVGIPVGVLAIVGIVVIFIMIRKRRSRIPKPLQAENDLVVRHEEVESLHNENEYDLYNDANEERKADQYQYAEYDGKHDNTMDDFDVYEIPNEETVDVDYVGVTEENRRDIYEVPSTEQSEDYSYSTAVERQKIIYLDDTSEISDVTTGDYFVLEKERTKLNKDIDVEPGSQKRLAYNHVQVLRSSPSGGENVDEYDLIIHTSGPKADRKDYDTTTINRDECNTYDTTTKISVKQHDDDTDNAYSETFKN